MIQGFANETAPLCERDKAVIPDVVDALKRAVGKENAVYNDDLQELTGLKPSRVRKVINHIRNNNLVPCLVASSVGYYVAETEQEMVDYEESLRNRANAILAVCESIKIQRIQRFGGQYELKLF